MNVLEVRGLRKKYESKRFFKKNEVVNALNGISFEVKEGEIFGILGPNGAGKSTTINIISDLLSHDEGSIKIFGEDYNKKTKARIKEDMSLINGYANQSAKLTVYQNMKIYSKIYQVKDFEKKIDELLELVELKEKKNVKFSKLSSGQKTRVNIVKGLLHDPKLILMDEPTIGLDPVIAKKIRELIIKINKEEKTTIIFTSHNMAEVEEICDRIALLKKGKILKISTIKEIIKLIDVVLFYIKFEGSSKKMKDTLEKIDIQNLKVESERAYFQTSQKFDFNKLLYLLTSNNIKVKKIEAKKPNLEQVFIHLAEGKL